jgi:hypothetical protein
MVKGTGDYLNDERGRQRQPMQLKAVSQYKEPGYPVQEYLMEHPELLRLVPKRWRGNATVLATLGMAAMLISSSRFSYGEQKTVHHDEKVAPVFIHGAGRSGFGCVAVSPPIFLSEDEALQVINQEAMKAGLDFIKMPEGRRETTVHGSKTVHLDAYDFEHRIAIEFVEDKETGDWDARHEMGTAGYTDTKEAAENVRSHLLKSNATPITGIFYDPECSFFDEYDSFWRDSTKMEQFKLYQREHPNLDNDRAKSQFIVEAIQQIDKDTQASDNPMAIEWRHYLNEHPNAIYRKEKYKFRSEYLLRLQVRDFMEWLKAQGII